MGTKALESGIGCIEGNEGMIEEEHERENIFKDEEIEEVEPSIVTADESELEITEKEFAAFVGRNADYYLPKFGKFIGYGGHKFELTWNWAAFFFTYIWMAYRRMYLWSAFCLLFYYVGFMFLVPLVAPQRRAYTQYFSSCQH